jgi:hypothetical protein
VQAQHHDRVFRGSKARAGELDLALSKVVDLALWLSELEQRILETSVQLERLRESIRILGSELGLDS